MISSDSQASVGKVGRGANTESAMQARISRRINPRLLLVRPAAAGLQVVVWAEALVLVGIGFAVGELLFLTQHDARQAPDPSSSR
jgi:hypothetical protein